MRGGQLLGERRGEEDEAIYGQNSKGPARIAVRWVKQTSLRLVSRAVLVLSLGSEILLYRFSASTFMISNQAPPGSIQASRDKSHE